MRANSLALIVSGVVLIGIAGLLSWVAPLRSESLSGTRRGITVTITTESSIWGRPLWHSTHSVIGPGATDEMGKPVAAGESPFEGPLDAQRGQVGTWTYRQRTTNSEWITVEHVPSRKR